MFQCLRTLEQRVQPLILSGVLGVSVLGSGCVAGPDGTTPLQRAFTQQNSVPSSQQSPPYATATVLPEPVSQPYSRSREESIGAGILKGASWLFGIHGDIVPAMAFDITADIEGRNALISGQKEAAEIIREGLQGKDGGQRSSSLPEGVGQIRLQEFGLVEFMIAPRYIDFNGNHNPERNELQPSTRITTKSGLWIASQHFDRSSIYKPFIKVFDEKGNILVEEVATEGRTQYWYIGNPHNQFPLGKYMVTFFGQVPPPGSWEQRPVGKQGVNYFLHAMPFEVVDE